MQFIPAIDLINNTCVRLLQGNYNLKTEYKLKTPLEMALHFESVGVKRLHIVDLDGAKNKKIKHLHILEKIANATQLQIDFGGGVQTIDDAKSILNAGAKYVTIGSLAVLKKETVLNWMYELGKENFLLGLDKSKEGKVAINAWLNQSVETVEDIIEFYHKNNFNHFFCTDINVDGSFVGPSINWYESIINKFKNIKLIASGGVHKIEDILELNKIGCSGAIVGKAIYENKISSLEIKNYCNAL